MRFASIDRSDYSHSLGARRGSFGPIACGITLLGAVACLDTAASTSEPVPGASVASAVHDPGGAPPVKQLALGNAHGCSLDPAISGVICWGDNRRGQTAVPTLLEPTSIAAGGDVSCAISSDGVRCWGDGTYGQLAVPYLQGSPLLIAVGDQHACALTANDRVVCWGDDSHGQLSVPPLSDVHALAAGAFHTCALAGNAVTCWGDDTLGQLEPPAITNPEQLAVGGDHACVLAGDEVQCWGGGSPALVKDVPSVINPTAIATGRSHACVLDERGVQCWADENAGDLIPRELTQTSQLAVGGVDGFGHACARHLQGVTCWGDNRLGQVDYDGRPLHVLHRAESEIDAPAEKIWAVLMDLPSYPLWNPYTIEMQSTLKVGDPMVMRVKMSELLTIEQTEHIRVIEEGHKICWGINTDTPEFNSGERCQWLEELESGGTRYITEDLIEGTANPLVSALFGTAVEEGFDAIAIALKEYVEAQP
jgi:alpha-tubulin suppressor-like RCC1 family protein